MDETGFSLWGWWGGGRDDEIRFQELFGPVHHLVGMLYIVIHLSRVQTRSPVAERSLRKFFSYLIFVELSSERSDEKTFQTFVKKQLKFHQLRKSFDWVPVRQKYVRHFDLWLPNVRGLDFRKNFLEIWGIKEPQIYDPVSTGGMFCRWIYVRPMIVVLDENSHFEISRRRPMN